MTKIGVIGAGQLGQMLALAGQKLGLEFVFLDPSDDPPAAQYGAVLKYDFDSEEGLQKLSAAADLITFEFENVPVSALLAVARETPVYPPPEALRLAQDRIAEKNLFDSLDIPVPEYRQVDSPADLVRAGTEIGLPLVLKTRRLGYDGKGQRLVRDESQFDDAIVELGNTDLIAEQWIPFDREISVIGARSARGEICIYPLTENEHRDGILHVSRAPADAGNLAETAQSYLRSLLENLNYVGVLALELFATGDRLLANEFAPRVHNSGHWTIEGAQTSQFENHLRAILDMPLGDAGMRKFAAMLNLIGTIPDDCKNDLEALTDVRTYLHDYGKSPRAGRKLGHITIVAASAAERDAGLTRLRNLYRT